MSVAEMLDHARDVRARLRGPVKPPRIKVAYIAPPVVRERPKPDLPIVVNVELKSPSKEELDEIAGRIRILRKELALLADRHGILVIDEEERRGPTVEDIQRYVAERHSLRRKDLVADRRDAPVILPRHIAMFLCKELTKHSLTSLGARFGKRDHTTLLAACRKITKMRAASADFDAEINHYIAELSKDAA